MPPSDAEDRVGAAGEAEVEAEADRHHDPRRGREGRAGERRRHRRPVPGPIDSSTAIQTMTAPAMNGQRT